MAVNFDALPQSNPYSREAIKPGVYRAVIEKAEMKAPKSGGKQYLELTYALSDKDGKSVGKFWDKQFDSDKGILQYKLSRFLTACKFPLSGAMELSDIGKLVVGKTIVVDIMNKTEGDKVTAEIEMFKRELYYKEEEFDAIHAIANALTPPAPTAESFNDIPDEVEADELPFNSATTAETAGQAATSSEY